MLRYAYLKVGWHNGKMAIRCSALPAFHNFLLASLCILLTLSAFHALPHGAWVMEDRCVAVHGAVDMTDTHDHHEESNILLAVHNSGIVDFFSDTGFLRMITTSSSTISPRLPPPKI